MSPLFYYTSQSRLVGPVKSEVPRPQGGACGCAPGHEPGHCESEPKPRAKRGGQATKQSNKYR